MIEGSEIPRNGLHQDDHRVSLSSIFDDRGDPTQMLTIASHVTTAMEVRLRSRGVRSKKKMECGMTKTMKKKER